MRCSYLESVLESLSGNYNLNNVSPRTFTLPVYNCIAWAIGENHRPWWPSKEDPYYYYWPPHLEREEYQKETVENFIRAFEWKGYTKCRSPKHKKGVVKVAIFLDSSRCPKHAARQLESGSWTSKCGDYEDIEHFTLSAVEGDLYGEAVIFMHKRINGKPFLKDAITAWLKKLFMA
jgi:hypothetical protein